MKTKKAAKKAYRPHHRRGARQIRVDAEEWDALRVRSRTLHALGYGGGQTCPKCRACLLVDGACPECRHQPAMAG